MSTPIDLKFAALGGEGGFLGRPTGSERACLDGVGRKCMYQHGAIYWHPDSGAHEVHGAILDRYRSWDQVAGTLGYPVSDEMDTPGGGRHSCFQHGLIVWTPEAGAHGIGEAGRNISPRLNLRHIGATSYGNLTTFFQQLYDWTGIDLMRNAQRGSEARRYLCWQVKDFSSDRMLNGRVMNPWERFALTAARILVMQWHLRDLEQQDKLRRGVIQQYFRHPANFKRNAVARWRKGRVRWVWHYNAWCSEFASFIYKAAGMPVYYGRRQGFVAKNIARYQKVGWCVTKYSYFDDIFRRANQWLRMDAVAKTKSQANTHYVPRLGDYLRSDSHSMLIMGTSYDEGPTPASRKLRLHILHGNTGHGAPEDRGKLVRYGSKLASDESLSGVGRMNLPTVTE